MRSLNLEGMAPLNGRTGGPATGNRILMVPEDMARLYNNSVSKSFAFWPEGAEAADMLQRTSNSFNMMLLAGPLFPRFYDYGGKYGQPTPNGCCPCR